MSERQICTRERPYTKRGEMNEYWLHPDAKCVDKEYNGLSGGGDYER